MCSVEVETNANGQFWDKVRIGGGDDCWEWQASRRPEGYGQINYQRKIWKSHRLSFFMANGFLPPVVMHSCDNPPCVNPKHLLAGTIRTNNTDKANKGRAVGPSLKGQVNPASKLTDTLVIQARARYSEGESFHSLARTYNVDRKTITQAVRGESWGHIK